jgi:serine/threonine protein kinase
MKRTHEKMSKTTKFSSNVERLDWDLIINMLNNKEGILLGKGSYSKVYWISYKKTEIAIKVNNSIPITEEFYDVFTEALTNFHIRSPNIANYLGFYIDKNKWKIYIAMKYYHGRTLLHFIRNKEDKKEEIKEKTVKTICYSLLNGIKDLNNLGLFHRDIKPSNILLKYPKIKNFKDIKIGDLNSISRINTEKNIVTRWYRPLEVELKSSYGRNIDIFSIGCILVELLTKKPILKSEKDGELHIIEIIKKFGNFSEDIIEYFDELELDLNLWDTAKNYNKKNKHENEIFKLINNLNISNDLKNIIKDCLELNPLKRPMVNKLLENEYFNEFKAKEFKKVLLPKVFYPKIKNNRTFIENSLIIKYIKQFRYSFVTYLISFDIFKKYSNLYLIDKDNLEIVIIIIIMISCAFNTDYDLSNYDLLKSLSKNSFYNLYQFRNNINIFTKMLHKNNILPQGNYYNTLSKFCKSKLFIFMYLTEENICNDCSIIEKINYTNEVHKKLILKKNYIDIIKIINVKDSMFLKEFYHRIKISGLSNIIKEEI